MSLDLHLDNDLVVLRNVLSVLNRLNIVKLNWRNSKYIYAESIEVDRIENKGL